MRPLSAARVRGCAQPARGAVDRAPMGTEREDKAKADKHPAHPQDPAKLQSEGHVSVAAVDRLAGHAQASGIAAPPRVNVGDLPVGKHTEIDVSIFNLEPNADAVITAAFDGDASL